MKVVLREHEEESPGWFLNVPFSCAVMEGKSLTEVNKIISTREGGGEKKATRKRQLTESLLAQDEVTCLSELLYFTDLTTEKRAGQECKKPPSHPLLPLAHFRWALW